ncbi:hypothetical protein BP6252_04725 [Coleophoma cylindrospora]|uniref:SH3 domain-containing protein n=1 Tax=Coleophoma cylindrospora TaxID=1849047 RepID=A0A3D8S1A6_9HELO|nr:hypothetical protein BP6252_04725 [Coleophoma cylindrospora]
MALVLLKAPPLRWESRPRRKPQSLSSNHDDGGSKADAENEDALGINYYKSDAPPPPGGLAAAKRAASPTQMQIARVNAWVQEHSTARYEAQPTALHLDWENRTNPHPSPNQQQKQRVQDVRDPIAFIDELLEDNYRAQAESFCRKPSRSHSNTITNSPGSVVSGPLGFRSPALTAPLSCRVSSTPVRLRPRRNSSNSASIQQQDNNTSRSTSPSCNREYLRTPETLKTPVTPYSNGTLDRPKPALLELQLYRSRPKRRFSATCAASSPCFGHRIKNLPISSLHDLHSARKSPVYFTRAEQDLIAAQVEARRPFCDHYDNCITCLNKEFAYLENKIMSTSMDPDTRQQIINNNRSLRTIKNELEGLLERNILTDDMYDAIMAQLPNESPLNGSLPAPRSASSAPTDAMARLNVNGPPPTYQNSTGNAPPPPPARNPTPSRPELCRAVALYRYAEPEDCSFEAGDQIAVYEYMNAEWWLGKNVRTNKEGVFPANYVQVQQQQPPNGGYYSDQKVGMGGYPAQPSYAQPPPGPGQSNPYNSAVPPMAIAEGGNEQPAEGKQPSKGSEMGKKFGKKLGNAAIFGAGATIGGNIVNSIF